MSDTLTAVLLVSTGARDGTRTLGSDVSVDCGKVRSNVEEVAVEVGGYDLVGRVEVLLGGTEE